MLNIPGKGDALRLAEINEDRLFGDEDEALL
jgi:hypothetical protein